MTDDVVLTGHGGGGKLARELLESLIMPAIGNADLHNKDDAATLPPMPSSYPVFTTDAYIVDPLFFPGGDIGMLAACGTINDLAMQAAEPFYLSLSLILEEGLPLSTLKAILESIRKIVAAKGISIVTGDTKVVAHGRCTGMYINTAGIGQRIDAHNVTAGNARTGDRVIVTGPVGNHGIAVIGQREGLNFDSPVISDAAPLSDLIRDLLDHFSDIHVLRDPTRGGLTTALHDISTASQCGIIIKEEAIPITEGVQGACQLLGLDPLNAANEGRAVVVCSDAIAEQVVERIRSHPDGHPEAKVIGEVTADPVGQPLMRTTIGGTRILPLPSGEELPRIC